MRITAGQLVRLILEIREECENKNFDLQRPEVICELILDRYPQLGYVEKPPTPQQLERMYLSRLLSAFDIPTMDSEPGPMQTAQPLADLPPDSQAERVLNEIGFLRCEPMAALTYTIMRALHHNQQESLDWARRSIGVWKPLSKANRKPGQSKGRKIPEEYTSDFIEKGLYSL
jgi:hypothetical protein